MKHRYITGYREFHSLHGLYPHTIRSIPHIQLEPIQLQLQIISIILPTFRYFTRNVRFVTAEQRFQSVILSAVLSRNICYSTEFSVFQ